MSKPTAKLMVISGPLQQTKFMQRADVFEESKVVGTTKYMNISFNEGTKLTQRHISLVIDSVKKALEESGELVTFIHLIQTQNGKIITFNQGEIAPYVNSDVRCVSDGESWYVLCDYLKTATGLDIITDEHRFVIGVGIKLENKIDSIKIKK